MKRSMIITSTKAGMGTKVQKTFSDVNPAATAQQMLTAARKINALSTNTYVQTDCVDKFNVDTEIPPADTRQDASIALTNPDSVSTQIWSELTSTGNSSQYAFSYNGDGQPYVYIKSGGGNVLQAGFAPYNNDANDVRVCFRTMKTDTKVGFTFILGAPGTDNYKPVEVEYAVNAPV